MKQKPSLSMFILGVCCLFILIPAVCSVFYFYHVVSGRMEDTAQDTVELYVQTSQDSLEGVLSTLRNGLYYLMQDADAQAYMLEGGPVDSLIRLRIEDNFNRAIFMGPALDRKLLSGIYLMKDADNYIPVLQSSVYRGTAERIELVYEQMREHNSARDLYQMDALPEYCYLLTDYLDLDTMEVTGKILIELASASLVDTSYITGAYPEAEVYLSRTDGALLYANSQSIASPCREGAGYVAEGYRLLYHRGLRLSPYNLRLDVYVPKAVILAEIRQTVVLYTAFTLAVLLLTLLLALMVYRTRMRPLRRMVDTIGRIGTGDLTARMEPTPYRETEVMAGAFNQMAEGLSDLFQEVYDKNVLLKRAEFDLLESQIHPHFIFNILEVINVRCMAAGQYDLCHIVSNLAKLLRSNVTNRGCRKITLEQELRYVQYYLELQKERYGESLRYKIELESDELLRYYLPKLTIQPLVENSVVHGLENKRGGGSVELSVWEDEDELYIRVQDDGIGFDPAALVQRDGDDPRHNHVAMNNVGRRIQFLYGPAYGMQINSTIGKGTSILINLPLDTTPAPEETTP